MATLVLTTLNPPPPPGLRGESIHARQEQLRSFLERRLGPEHAHLLAEAIPRPGGEGIDWYSAADGPVSAVSALPPPHRAALLARVARLTAEVEALAERIRQASGSEANLMARSLELALQRPGEELLFLVGKQPVVVGWGYPPGSAAHLLPPDYTPPLNHPASDLPGNPALPTATAAPSPAPPPAGSPPGPAAVPPPPGAATTPPPPPATGWRWLIPLGLLLLLILLLTRLGAPHLLPWWPGAEGPAVPIPPPDPAAEQLAALQREEGALRQELERLEGELATARAACPPPPAPEPPPREEPPPVEPAPLEQRVAPDAEEPPPPEKEPPALKQRVAPEKTEKPSPPEEEPPALDQRPPKPPAGGKKLSCPQPRKPWERPEVILVLDASGSMGMPAAVDGGREASLIQRADRGDRNAILELMRLMGRSGPKRLDLAKEASVRLVDALPPDVDIGFLHFTDCDAVVNHRFFGHGDRPRLKDQIRGLQPREKTPLSRAIQRAGNSASAEKVSLIVVSDGRDSCHGDPCATVRQLRRSKPNVTVHLVDLTGSKESHCIANEGGGRIFQPRDAASLARALQEASGERPLPPGCKG